MIGRLPPLWICLISLAGVYSATAIGQSPSRAVVAIASGSTINLYDESGNAVRSIHLKGPTAGFAFSPDRSRLVVVAPDTEHGGALWLIDLKTGQRRKLTPSHHFAFQHLDKGESEVYDSPAFSPDGRTLAFAVHGNLPGDGNDAFENSGPLAIVELNGGAPRVLKATNHIGPELDEPCSESDPQWSSDGKWILFNCEDGGFLTDPQGNTVRHLKTDGENAGSSAVGWVGTKCIFYVQTPEQNGQFDFEHESVKLLNFNTGKSSDASGMLTGFPTSQGGLVQASDAVVIRSDWPNSVLIIETRKKQWRLRLDNRGPRTVAAQLMTGWSEKSIPSVCK